MTREFGCCGSFTVQYPYVNVPYCPISILILIFSPPRRTAATNHARLRRPHPTGGRGGGSGASADQPCPSNCIVTGDSARPTICPVQGKTFTTTADGGTKYSFTMCEEPQSPVLMTPTMLSPVRRATSAPRVLCFGRVR